MVSLAMSARPPTTQTVRRDRYLVPPEVRDLVDRGLIQETTAEGSSPSFAVSSDRSVTLWVQDPDPARRGRYGKRFTVTGEGDCVWFILEETDSLRALLAYLKDHWAVC